MMAPKTTICVSCGMGIASKNYKMHYMTNVEAIYECQKCDKVCSIEMALLRPFMQNLINCGKDIKC